MLMEFDRLFLVVLRRIIRVADVAHEHGAREGQHALGFAHPLREFRADISEGEHSLHV